MNLKNSWHVAVGGGSGVILRYFFIVLFDDTFAIPAAILIANMLGCFILGYVAAHPVLKKNAILLLGTGFAGGLTTFSNFAFDLFWLAESQSLSSSVLYGISGIVSGVVAGVSGYRLPRYLRIYRFMQRRRSL
ncbi:MAG: CrcB family protein [Rhodothermaceae bacterium]|nr:CrcB family protein [Rhodothermaceae bacterium]